MTDSSHNSVLIAGIGNIFFGDDAFGSEVARRLQRRVWPANVRVVDFGIRGIDLTYALLDGYACTILIDAAPRGEPPGTLFTIEPELEELRGDAVSQLDGHSLDPLQVLRTVLVMGGTLQRILLVGCEPADLGGEEGRLGLSPVVEAAIDDACDLVVSQVTKFLAGATPPAKVASAH